MTPTPQAAITWSTYDAMVHWMVDVCLENDPEVSMTWKGPAPTEEDARTQALRDVPIALRASAHLACTPIAAGKAKAKILGSGRRLGDTDDFHLVTAKGHAATYVEMARMENSYRGEMAEKAREAACALVLIAASLCDLAETGTLHLSFGTLDEPDSDGKNTFIFDGHVLPQRQQNIFLRAHWPDAFGAAVIAISMVYGLCGGDHTEGQVQHQIPDSATLRAQERYAIRAQAPMLIQGPIEMMRLCGLDEEATALGEAFGFGTGEFDEE